MLVSADADESHSAAMMCAACCRHRFRPETAGPSLSVCRPPKREASASNSTIISHMLTVFMEHIAKYASLSLDPIQTLSASWLIMLNFIIFIIYICPGSWAKNARSEGCADRALVLSCASVCFWLKIALSVGPLLT